MRSSLPLRGYSSGSGIIPLQQHDQSIVDVEFGKAKDAPSSTFFLCPYFRLWASPSSMRLACGRPLSRPRKSILVSGQLRCLRRSPVYHRAGLCRGREVCLVQEMAAIYPVPGQTSPAAAAAPKQAPVYRCADCRAPNRRLFTVAQIAGTQTGACLPPRRLHSLKQAPVYHCADCVAPNRRLFIAAQIA